MSWYRTYRPQTVAGLHSTTVRDAYTRILKAGSFSHAYLMAGPKGTGKTSGARILAKVLNCEKNAAVVEQEVTGKGKKGVLLEPCNTCASCQAITAGRSMAVVEIDAASNRGIDDIRTLRESIGLLPPDGRVAVYIIDEVHMLTTEAFNALLKILEEPPRHAVFMLATTEQHKLPATILSRCTIIPYTKATAQEILAALGGIVQQEGISIDAALLTRFVLAADGSFRDAVKLLEQVCTGKTQIAQADIDAVLGASLREAAIALIQVLLRKSYDDVYATFTRVEEQGTDMLALQKEVIRLLLEASVTTAKTANQKQEYIRLLRTLAVPLQPGLPIAHLPFQLAALSWCVTQPTDGGETVSEVSSAPSVRPQPVRAQSARTVSIPAKSPEVPAKKESDKGSAVPVPARPSIPSDAIAPTLEQVRQKWSTVLASVKHTNASLEAFLRSCRPVLVDQGVVWVEALYKFHKEQLEVGRNRQVVEQQLAVAFAYPLRLEIRLAQKGVQASHSMDSNLSGSVEDITLVEAAQEVFLT